MVSFHYLGKIWGSSAGPFRIGESHGDVLIAYGEISIVGGFVVNRITLDGAPTVYARPKTGQIVELYKSSVIAPGGVYGEGTWIDIQRTVVGPIEAIDADHLRMTILGQEVYVTEQTRGERNSLIADAFDFADVAVGDLVAVSGHFSAAGQVMATLIESIAEPTTLVLRGVLTAQANGMFGIGDQVLDLSGASLEGFPGGTPLPGDAVLLFAENQRQGGVLIVQTARYASGSWDPLVDEIYEFDGFMTAFEYDAGFEISGHRLFYETWECETCRRLENVSGDPAVGRFVTFAGRNLRLRNLPWTGEMVNGPVDSIDSSAAAFTIAGFPVQTNPSTLITADAEPWVGSDSLEVSDLSIGDKLTVSGGIRLVAGDIRWEPDDILVAGSVIPAGKDIQVHTQLYKRDDPNIIFLGQNILTDASTTVTLCDGNGACSASATPKALFDNTDYFAPTLTIDIDPDSVPLRATNILMVRDP
jgi:hypothetical protein